MQVRWRQDAIWCLACWLVLAPLVYFGWLTEGMAVALFTGLILAYFAQPPFERWVWRERQKNKRRREEKNARRAALAGAAAAGSGGADRGALSPSRLG